MMTPDEAEAHARSAKRQFDALGIDAHIDPEEIRDIAAERAALRACPATVGQIEDLKSDVAELKRLILSMKTASPVVNVSYSGAVDAVDRTMYQVSKAASKALIAAR